MHLYLKWIAVCVVAALSLAGIAFSKGGEGKEQPAAAPAASAAPGFTWLSGTWRLEDGDVVCDEYWAAPRAGTQSGTFRLTKGTETEFLEMFCIRRSGEKTWLYIRHFSPGLKPWQGEEQGPLSWRLVETGVRRATFANDRSRIVYHRASDTLLVVRLEPVPAEGESKPAQTFRFTRRQ